jgi:hypothetical protein
VEVEGVVSEGLEKGQDKGIFRFLSRVDGLELTLRLRLKGGEFIRKFHG